MKRLPKLGFVGVGWIGRHRMEAVLKDGSAVAAAICDEQPDMVRAAQELAPSAIVTGNLQEMLALDLDGVVIATPSALHAEQSIAALELGKAVFCQKPLGRSAAETRKVVEAAKRSNLSLGVDLCYRNTVALRKLREVVTSGELGDIYAVHLVFHNAYGPDKPWFYDRRLSGGGCVMDLGIHLIDAALWLLDFPEVRATTSRVYAQGQLLPPNPEGVEDYATAQLDLEGGCTVQVACSWRLPAGQDAVISAELYGTKAGAAFRNVGGSFYDFIAELYRGTQRTQLAEPPDAWGGRTMVEWARQLGEGKTFDASVGLELIRVAEVVDKVYANAAQSATRGSESDSAALQPARRVASAR